MTADYTRWAFPKDEWFERLGVEVGAALPPCTFGTPLMAYFDQTDVRTALHIPTADPAIGPWEMCTSNINYTELEKASQWIYEELAGKVRALKFSGDIDGAVPTDGTLGWINNLNRTATEEWRPYYTGTGDDKVLGGYLEAYEGDLTFGSVHGAGHMTPTDKPKATYHLVFNWLFERPI